MNAASSKKIFLVEKVPKDMSAAPFIFPMNSGNANAPPHAPRRSVRLANKK